MSESETSDNNNHNNSSWLSASSLRRLLFFLGADALIVALSLFVAFLVHFDFNSNIRYFSLIGEIALFFVALNVFCKTFFPIVANHFSL